jgi:hypothetical protein
MRWFLFYGLFIFLQESFEAEEVVELPILDETSLAKMEVELKKTFTPTLSAETSKKSKRITLVISMCFSICGYLRGLMNPKPL